MCDCDDQCAEFSSCMCVSYPDTPGSCECDCWGPIVIAPSAAKSGKRSADSPVDLCIKNADLALFAEFLSKRLDVQILIPAERVRESVSMKVTNSTVQSVAQKVGLVIGLTANDGRVGS